jgi:hypothetical protein
MSNPAQELQHIQQFQVVRGATDLGTGGAGKSYSE